MSCTVPDGRSFEKDSVPEPSGARTRRALLARVVPAWKASTGNRAGRVKSVAAAVGSAMVTFAEMETAAAGMPHVPVTTKSRFAPAASAGPPSAEGGLLVSGTRHGAVGWKDVALTGPVVIRAILSPRVPLLLIAVNHTLPSGPDVMAATSARRKAGPVAKATNSVTTPSGVIRPIWLAPDSVNHKLPSGPAVMPAGCASGVMPALNSVTTPSGVIRPIRLPPISVNHRLPSGPAVMPAGCASGVMPALNSGTTPSGVIRPIWLAPDSVNQRLPSGPAVMLAGCASGVMPPLNSVTAPRGVIRPIGLAAGSVNHRLPSEPAAIPTGCAKGVMPALNSVTTPSGVIRPIWLAPDSVNQRLPSGPAVMPVGKAKALVPAPNSVTTPRGVIRPTRLAISSANQRLPSGPVVMLVGVAPPVMLNSVTLCARTAPLLSPSNANPEQMARTHDPHRLLSTKNGDSIRAAGLDDTAKV